MTGGDFLAERFATAGSHVDDSDWADVRRRARRPRRSAVVFAALAAVAICAAPALALHDELGGLFVQGESAPPSEPVITSAFGTAPAGLDARMDAGVARGPYAVQCDPAAGQSLVCHDLPDGEALSALKRGEVAYGRTAIGFPNGARPGRDEVPMFGSGDLICAEPVTRPLVCYPVTAVQPTIRAGADVFVYYARYHVTFDKRGNPVGWTPPATVSLRVLPR